jgi:hypothetical protein
MNGDNAYKPILLLVFPWDVGGEKILYILDVGLLTKEEVTSLFELL